MKTDAEYRDDRVWVAVLEVRSSPGKPTAECAVLPGEGGAANKRGEMYTASEGVADTEGGSTEELLLDDRGGNGMAEVRIKMTFPLQRVLFI